MRRALRAWETFARPPDSGKETAAGAENTEAAEGMARDNRNGITAGTDSVSAAPFTDRPDPCEVTR